MALLSNPADLATRPIEGRRIGIVGDGETGVSSLLQVDNAVVGATRSGAAPLFAIITSLAGAGAITLAGAIGTSTSPTKLGDNVVKVIDLTGVSDVTSSFEATLSVTGQIQQTGALTAGHTLLAITQPNS